MTADHNSAAKATVFYDHIAEAAVLGAMLLEPAVIAEVEAIVDAEAFHEPSHKTLFEVLAQRRADNQPTDLISIGSHLAATNRLHKLPGGIGWLATLTEQIPAAASGTHYARIVADRALLRELDKQLARVQQMIREGAGESPAELVERARDAVTDLGARAVGSGGWVQWRDLIQPGLDAMEAAGEPGAEPPGIPTGLPDLDRVISGLQDGRLIVVAGQPGSGKSTLASDLVRSAAFHHKLPTGLFTMEMGRLEVFNRAILAEAGVEAEKVTTGKLELGDWTVLVSVAGDTKDAPLFIDDTKGLTLADIRVRARRLKQRHGLRLLVVDYLGLIECRNDRPRNQQVDELARAFKNLAGELDCPVVLLAQLNRNASHRADKRPILQDLKESGGIESHADIVIFVHREEQYDKTKRKGEADLIVKKNRTGPERDVVVAAQLHLNRFYSMALEGDHR